MSEGGKIVKTNCPRGDKIGEKSYPRRVKLLGKMSDGVKLDKTVWGSQEKNMCEGGKKSCFASEGVRKIPVFVQGVEIIPILSEGVMESFLPLLFF